MNIEELIKKATEEALPVEEMSEEQKFSIKINGLFRDLRKEKDLVVVRKSALGRGWGNVSVNGDVYKKYSLPTENVKVLEAENAIWTTGRDEKQACVIGLNVQVKGTEALRKLENLAKEWGLDAQTKSSTHILGTRATDWERVELGKKTTIKLV